MADTEQTKQPLHEQWSSRWAFIFAATGSAVGLGNIWRFPYMAGERGGALFVLAYLACVFIIGIPLMIAETLIGRRGHRDLVSSMQHLAAESGIHRGWALLGWSMVFTGILILSYYSVLGGWTVAYIFKMGAGGLSGADASVSGAVFNAFVSAPVPLFLWHTMFMILTVAVVARGVQGGLEKAVRILVPLLLVLLLVLAGYAATTDGFWPGVKYLFVPDLEKLAATDTLSGIVLPAMGQAFFTLSLGMGAIMVYGSYLPRNVSISTAICAVALLDSAVALLAGLVIFPIVFTHGMSPDSGASLLFITLPVAFGLIPFGAVLGVLFFILLLVAAWSSSISLLEPSVNLLNERLGLRRVSASLAAGIVAWLLGILSVLSFNHWAFDFSFLGRTKSEGIFDILDILTSTFMLPLHGLIIAVFVAWVMKRAHCVEELGLGDGRLFQLWYLATRYVAPVGVILLFLHASGLLDFMFGK